MAAAGGGELRRLQCGEPEAVRIRDWPGQKGFRYRAGHRPVPAGRPGPEAAGGCAECERHSHLLHQRQEDSRGSDDGRVAKDHRPGAFDQQMSSSLNRFAIPVLAALSLADAAYLSVLHWRGEIPPCGGYAGCETVNTSPFAEIFGVPIAAFGMVLSAAILAIAIFRARVAGRQWLYATLALYALVLSAA